MTAEVPVEELAAPLPGLALVPAQTIPCHPDIAPRGPFEPMAVAAAEPQAGPA
jgi:hypothetical protein